MGQAESSKEFLADKHLHENHRPVNCFPPGSAGNEILVSSPGKRNMAKSEDKMEIKSKLRRISEVDGEETPDIFEDKARKVIGKMLLNLLTKEKLLPEKLKRGRILPKLEGNYFRFGDDPIIDEEFVIYMRLDGCGHLWSDLLERSTKSGNKIETLLSLQYDAEEFHQRRIPFDSNSVLDVKFHVKCNKANLNQFLKNLSAKIQVLMAADEQDGLAIHQPVLESGEISFGSLNHQMASLSLCKVCDNIGGLGSVHNINCYVFLDQVSPAPQNSKQVGRLCTNCNKGSLLLRVFNEVKGSSGIILDIASPEEAIASMEVDPGHMVQLLNSDGESVGPVDLSISKMGTPGPETETMKIEPKNLSYMQQPTSKAESKLTKVMRARPIKRKHEGRSRQAYLINKVKEIEKRLLALKTEQELTESGSQGSDGQQSDILNDDAEVPSHSTPKPQPANFAFMKNPYGPTTILRAISPKAVPSNTPLKFTSAPSCGKGEKTRYNCPKPGCSESFNSTALFLSRCECHNSDHASARPGSRPPILTDEVSHTEAVSEKVLNWLRTQHPEKSFREKASKVDAKLTKLMRAKLIKRKYARSSRKLCLINRIKENQSHQALKAKNERSKNRLPEKSSNQAGLSARVEVASDSAVQPQSAESSSNIAYVLEVLLVPDDLISEGSQ